MTEAEIIKGCVYKDQVCQRLLYERFAGKMLSLCQRYSRDQQEAKDITQEGFL
jgi:DNA-directed RNA polymerase specialized sigma24 family protein